MFHVVIYCILYSFDKNKNIFLTIQKRSNKSNAFLMSSCPLIISRTNQCWGAGDLAKAPAPYTFFYRLLDPSSQF